MERGPRSSDPRLTLRGKTGTPEELYKIAGSRLLGAKVKSLSGRKFKSKIYGGHARAKGLEGRVINYDESRGALVSWNDGTTKPVWTNCALQIIDYITPLGYDADNVVGPDEQGANGPINRSDKPQVHHENFTGFLSHFSESLSTQWKTTTSGNEEPIHVELPGAGGNLPHGGTGDNEKPKVDPPKSDPRGGNGEKKKVKSTSWGDPLTSLFKLISPASNPPQETT